MVSGFAKTERTLKCLFLRKLYLWPRFQVIVDLVTSFCKFLDKMPRMIVALARYLSFILLLISKDIIRLLCIIYLIAMFAYVLRGLQCF